MALQKQPIDIKFAQGLDTKTDSKQVPIGKFLALQNSVFDTVGQLTKRPGNALITTLPTTLQTNFLTLNDNLITTGQNILAYSEDTNQWLNEGVVQPVHLSVQELVRTNTSQSSQDSATAPNGLVCLTYIDSGAAYYQISDSITGQQIVQRTALPATSSMPKVFVLGNYFIVTFYATVSGSTHLQYIAISINTLTASPAAVNFSSSVYNSSQPHDGVVVAGNLYLAWISAFDFISLAYLTPELTPSAPLVIGGATTTLLSLAADTAGAGTIWLATLTAGLITAQAFSNILAPLCTLGSIPGPGGTVENLTSAVYNGQLIVFYEVYNTYPSGVQTDYVASVTGVMTAGAAVLSASAYGPLRSVGLASKAFVGPTGTIYVLTAYGETNQPTYFLVDAAFNIYMRLAYSNGGGYISARTLPSVSLINNTFQVSYLYKDLLTNVNKTTIPGYAGPTTAFYTQTGVNLASFTINTSGQYSSEIAGSLHLTGGQLWQYDGVKPVEHGFQVWPENITATPTIGTGSMAAQKYFYQFTYEWTDAAGNLHRSAPSIPLSVTLSATGEVTLVVPTLRLTYKTGANNVRIVGYRWSTAQQVYYQFTAIPGSVSNDTTVDYVTIVDTLADSAILGQTLLYTTGGVVEDIAAPASTHSALYGTRLFLIDAEDPNLLWYSKQVIENVPVEMSDLFTLYVAPTTGAQGSTGPCTALAAMDDKLIIFKANAAYYVTGTGPDNTGASNDFSNPIFITSSVGCANPNSIVLMQNGLMFQSSKGIWLLGRDLSTSYIGAPVEKYNSNTVLSAQNIPNTNQVRFILDNNVTLVYDYFMQQWGTFSNVLAISSTLYQGKHTYLNNLGQVYQEAPGTYTDGSTPVLMSFTTSWINIAGLQGYERFYQMLLLGSYFTPFKLQVNLAYDYNPSSSQATLVTPDNYDGGWGTQSVWGSPSGWGGVGQPFQARVFPQVQKCESFQITINELYDPSYGAPAGNGLSLSGLNLLCGVKKGTRTSKAGRSFG